jgi:hypothetical protein
MKTSRSIICLALNDMMGLAAASSSIFFHLSSGLQELTSVTLSNQAKLHLVEQEKEIKKKQGNLRKQERRT